MNLVRFFSFAMAGFLNVYFYCLMCVVGLPDPSGTDPGRFPMIFVDDRPLYRLLSELGC